MRSARKPESMLEYHDHVESLVSHIKRSPFVSLISCFNCLFVCLFVSTFVSTSLSMPPLPSCWPLHLPPCQLIHQPIHWPCQPSRCSSASSSAHLSASPSASSAISSFVYLFTSAPGCSLSVGLSSLVFLSPHHWPCQPSCQPICQHLLWL